MLCRTWRSVGETEGVRDGARLRRDKREGSARSREDVGCAEGRMGRSGTREEANEPDMARGTVAWRTDERERRRASEGGSRGMFSVSYIFVKMRWY